MNTLIHASQPTVTAYRNIGYHNHCFLKIGSNLYGPLFKRVLLKFIVKLCKLFTKACINGSLFPL